MLILERSVTKYYWKKMYRYLFRKIQRGQYDRLPGGIIRLPCGKGCLAYAILRKHENHVRPVGWLYLYQKPGWAAWEVLQVYVFENFREQGLGKKLYEAAINHDGLIMASGKTQSKYSRAVWKSFVKRGAFDVYAVDYRDLKIGAEVLFDPDFNELICDLPIYESDYMNHRDVRLIATRNKT